MELIPIKQYLEENEELLKNAGCKEPIKMTVDYYKIIGFTPPWIGYVARVDNELVGVAGFKGKPMSKKVEIAYGTFRQFRGKGIGTEICKGLVHLSLGTDSTIRITARTLPEESESVSILKKNGFALQGPVWDQEDGEVWEWEYENTGQSS